LDTRCPKTKGMTTTTLMNDFGVLTGSIYCSISGIHSLFQITLILPIQVTRFKGTTCYRTSLTIGALLLG
jgi:hypothetical protein